MLVGVAKGKLYRWYKDILSGFSEPDTQENLHHYDIRTKEIDHRTQQEQIIRVPILKPENLEAEMAIDEKYIGGEFYTILSNRINGKIALMAGTLKSEQLCGLLSHFHEKLFTVKHITRDLSGSYDWVCRQMFMNAAHTADKFHILTHLFDALQSVRIYHRQKILTMQREALEAFKKQEKEQKDLFKNTVVRLKFKRSRSRCPASFFCSFRSPKQYYNGQKYTFFRTVRFRTANFFNRNWNYFSNSKKIQIRQIYQEI